MARLPFIATALAAVVVAGCASVTNSTTQQISITARDKAGFVVTGARCTWKNSRSYGEFTTPAVVDVRRDYAALHLTCRKDGLPDALESASSRATGAMGGNLIAGGLIGAAVDHTSGTAYDYPASLTVWFGALQAPNTQPPRLAHARAVPAASGFARIDEIDKVPVREEGRPRFVHYLGLPAPKAFVIVGQGGWRFQAGDAEAMRKLLDGCAAQGATCALYAVDDRVVWQDDPARRITRSGQLEMP